VFSKSIAGRTARPEGLAVRLFCANFAVAMTKPQLTEQDFQRAADILGCDVPAIKAVAEVESKGDGFYDDGFPTILFERHVFAKKTGGRFNRSHPEISSWTPGGYGPAGGNQRRKFNIAFRLDPIAAMLACSWGKFQVMGFNYRVCGFDDVGSFVDAMKESEGRHLDAFVAYIIKNNLAGPLRRHDWKRVAAGYNGAGYRKNRYDEKMAAAFDKYNR
jgi:hypothetical protein